MDIVISLMGALLAWRFLLCFGVAAVIGFFVGHVLGHVMGGSIVLCGVGFGLMWQARWQSGTALFASIPSPPLSKPVVFMGLAFIGALLGGFTAELLGSFVGGAVVLLASLALVGSWRALVFQTHWQVKQFAFFAFSLQCGLASLYVAVVLVRA
jgi:hypothetical protein